MILGVPVVDGHELTKVLLDSLVRTTAKPEELTVVIIDNASEKSYEEADYKVFPFSVDILRFETNAGYYRPLKALFDEYGDEEIGLIHNDMVIYTQGWDEILRQAFAEDPQLGLVGLCGSNEIDSLGGRGQGTMCNFIGNEIKVGQTTYRGQAHTAGLHIAGIRSACVLDSLFMMFRYDVISSLVSEGESWDDLPLAHFYDRIWPCRVIEAGYHVAIAGIDCDHLGGMTTTANMRYYDDCVRWLDDHNQPFENPETEMYLLAERRFLGEYRDQKRFLPCHVTPDYRMEHLA